MNIYYLAFKYKQDVNVAVVTANQLANELLGNTDDIIGLKWNNEHGDSETGISDQGYTNHFFIDGQRCVVEFSDKDPHFFDLYKYKKEGEYWVGEGIIAKHIPWICTMIKDEEGNIIYDLNKEV